MTAQLPSSKEQLLADIAHAEEKAATLCGPCADDHARLAGYLRALLAAHEQEPVAWQYRVSAGKATGWSLWHNGNGEEYEKSYQVERRPLYTHPAPVPAAVPDGYVLMPMKLTAENGAKYALSGEFHVLHRMTCHECGGEGCSDCDDEGSFEEKIMIGWDDIKDIYRAAVEACSIKSTGEGV